MGNHEGSDWQSWKLVNNLLPKHPIFNNRNVFDQKTIANSFNEYFANVGPKLASEITQFQI